MQRVPVESRAIKGIGYENGTLEIKFSSDKVNSYYSVPHSVYISLMKSSSIGKYFNQHIRDQYISS